MNKPLLLIKTTLFFTALFDTKTLVFLTILEVHSGNHCTLPNNLHKLCLPSAQVESNFWLCGQVCSTARIWTIHFTPNFSIKTFTKLKPFLDTADIQCDSKMTPVMIFTISCDWLRQCGNQTLYIVKKNSRQLAFKSVGYS